MTTDEAKQAIHMALKLRNFQCEAVFAEKTSWWTPMRGNYYTWSVGVQPGLNGETSQSFMGDSLPNCVNACLTWRKPEPNNE